jgi:hypothetical protein
LIPSIQSILSILAIFAAVVTLKEEEQQINKIR